MATVNIYAKTKSSFPLILDHAMTESFATRELIPKHLKLIGSARFFKKVTAEQQHSQLFNFLMSFLDKMAMLPLASFAVNKKS